MRKHQLNKSNCAQHMARYQSSDINDKLIINLRDLSHIMRSLYEGKGSQKQVLIVLGKTGAITQRALTELLGIQPGSASEVISKLESAGLILRTPSQSDRRTADIVLTGEGKNQASQAIEQRIRRHQEMFSCLSEAEKRQMLSLLEKINADWDQRYRNSENKEE
jgi:DNA-binding MarR family transcriptional regulator